ncbi:zein-binding protein (Protein of unknown function, DUF593) [Tasmannia lanceolata]|uniref:zein-binding protein (Protein of unknown function, DUF593) n=1 Tax=Tasmannia lanceolata TaxID=3420 RepID=UPI004063CE0E
MAETEVSDLKETLLSQHQVIQKLSLELEREREASATAVNEALSMILRLQGERAAEKMEARQYKRMAEEKMDHAEESLAIFEEIMYRKDMEIASLEFQVEAYRHKLLSIGFSDFHIEEMQFLGNLCSFTSEACLDDMSIHGKVRRHASLPILPFKGSKSEMNIILREGPPYLLGELPTRKIDEVMVHEFDGLCESRSRGLLNEENDHESYNGIHGKTTNAIYSTSLALSNNTLYKSRGKGLRAKLDFDDALSCSSSQAEHPEILPEVDVCSSAQMETEITEHSTSVHDIFEVPQNHDRNVLSENLKLEAQKEVLKDENGLEKPDSMPQGMPEYNFKCPYHESEFSTTQNRAHINCHWSLIDPKICISLSPDEVLQINKRLQLLEDDRKIVKQEDSGISKEELKLLRDIHEQLKTIESQITRPKVMKRSRPDDSALIDVMQAMLFFSL